MYPEIAKEITRKVSPTITDIEHIPNIYQRFQQTKHEDKLLFIAVVLKLYCPGVFLLHSEYCQKGVVSQLGIILGKRSQSHISHLVSQAKAYMKIPSFAEQVEKVREEVWG